VKKILIFATFVIAFLLRALSLGFLPSSLPAAILGTLTIIAFYFFLRKNEPKGAESLALVAAFLLAINPWHILTSRYSWQLNLLLLGIIVVLSFFFHFDWQRKIKKTVVLVFFSQVFFFPLKIILDKDYLLERYFSHFSAGFLFFNGNWSLVNRVFSYQGVMFFLDVVFLILGLSALIRKERSKLENLMLLWLLLAPLPSLLLPGLPSLISYNFVIPLVFVAAKGVQELIDILKKVVCPVRVLGYLLLGGGYAFCFLRFLDLAFHRL